MLLAEGLILRGRDVNIRMFAVEEAPWMEGEVALPHGALHARARLLLLADDAFEGATGGGHAGIIDQFQFVGLRETHVGQPDSTLDMCPVPCGGGFEGTASVATKSAADLTAVHAILTQTAKPFPDRNSLHTVTALVHAQVTMVTEYYLVVILAVAFPADSAEDVLLWSLGTGVGAMGAWFNISCVGQKRGQERGKKAMDNIDEMDGERMCKPSLMGNHEECKPTLPMRSSNECS